MSAFGGDKRLDGWRTIFSICSQSETDGFTGAANFHNVHIERTAIAKTSLRIAEGIEHGALLFKAERCFSELTIVDVAAVRTEDIDFIRWTIGITLKG